MQIECLLKILYFALTQDYVRRITVSFELMKNCLSKYMMCILHCVAVLNEWGITPRWGKKPTRVFFFFVFLFVFVFVFCFVCLLEVIPATMASMSRACLTVLLNARGKGQAAGVTR